MEKTGLKYERSNEQFKIKQVFTNSLNVFTSEKSECVSLICFSSAISSAISLCNVINK